MIIHYSWNYRCRYCMIKKMYIQKALQNIINNVTVIFKLKYGFQYKV